MSNFQTIRDGNELLVIEQERGFKIRICYDVDVNSSSNNYVYFLAVFQPIDGDNRQLFEIDVAGDPFFDKWDSALFMDAITFYLTTTLNIRKFTVSIPDNPSLYPYDLKGPVFASYDVDTDPGQTVLPF